MAEPKDNRRSRPSDDDDDDLDYEDVLAEPPPTNKKQAENKVLGLFEYILEEEYINRIINPLINAKTKNPRLGNFTSPVQFFLTKMPQDDTSSPYNSIFIQNLTRTIEAYIFFEDPESSNLELLKTILEKIQSKYPNLTKDRAQTKRMPYRIDAEAYKVPITAGLFNIVAKMTDNKFARTENERKSLLLYLQKLFFAQFLEKSIFNAFLTYIGLETDYVKFEDSFKNIEIKDFSNLQNLSFILSQYDAIVANLKELSKDATQDLEVQYNLKITALSYSVTKFPAIFLFLGDGNSTTMLEISKKVIKLDSQFGVDKIMRLWAQTLFLQTWFNADSNAFLSFKHHATPITAELLFDNVESDGGYLINPISTFDITRMNDDSPIFKVKNITGIQQNNRELEVRVRKTANDVLIRTNKVTTRVEQLKSQVKQLETLLQQTQTNLTQSRAENEEGKKSMGSSFAELESLKINNQQTQKQLSEKIAEINQKGTLLMDQQRLIGEMSVTLQATTRDLSLLPGILKNLTDYVESRAWNTCLTNQKKHLEEMNTSMDGVSAELAKIEAALPPEPEPPTKPTPMAIQ